MKFEHWKILSLLLACLVIFIAPSCAKKKVSSEPAIISADDEARRRAEEEAMQRQRELTEQDLSEGSLKEGGLKDQGAKEFAGSEREAVENEDIHFEFDSVQLTPEAQEILAEKARWLQNNPRARVIIEGHCDNRGTDEYNIALGEGRAQSAREYLVAMGIDSNRLRTVSYGEERPLDPAQTEEAWAKNRRAHFVIEN